MRVLHVIDRFSRAGAETSLREFVAATEGSIGHGICVLHPGGNAFDGSPVPVEHRYVPGERLVRSAAVRHVSGAIEEFQPDLVHTVLFDANTAGRIAAWRRSPRVLTSLVNTPYVAAARREDAVPAWKRQTVRSVDRLLSRFATDHFHAITAAVAEEYVRDFRIDPTHITVVPRARSRSRLGEPSAERRAEVRDRFGLDEDTFLVLSLGRQEHQKGQCWLLEAAPGILQRHPTARIWVGGREGAATSSLQRLHRDLGLDDRVAFLGYRADVGDLLASADVFAFPSRYEGLGGAVLEAMAMDVPIVASDVPALSEVLDGGRAGLLFPTGDPQAIAAAIDHVVADREATTSRTRAARDRYEREYRPDSVNRRMLEMYERVIAS